MRKVKNLIAFFVGVQLYAAAGYAAEFTVTSNADSGPGTLRDMLLRAAANGAAEADVIAFNLPDQTEGGRTIAILSELPPVSSNLTIDGSTQPGVAFGVSTAKVKISIGFQFSDIGNVLSLEQLQRVNIYGLYIKNEFVCSGDHCYYIQGIAIRDCRDIEIGAAGKGNVILGFQHNVGMNVFLPDRPEDLHCVNVNLKGNFLGIEPDGKTLSQAFPGISAEFTHVNGEVNIGGTPEEGNLFPHGFIMNQFNSQNYTDEAGEAQSMPANIHFSHNKVGIDYTGSATSTSFGFHFGVFTPNGKNTILIEDNIISSTRYGIFVMNNAYEITIRRNYIGTDRSLTRELPMGDTGIFVYYCTQVKIGTTDPSDKNYIAHCKPVDVWPYSTVSVNKNSFFCVNDMYPMILVQYGTLYFPTVNITTISGTHVSGTATPNAVIELFYADACGTCAPETYFASTAADAAGNWRYDGSIQGVVIASATHNGSTSEFARTAIDFSEAKIENTCPIYGSITGIVPSSFTTIEWINKSGEIVANTPDLLNVPPGEYQLRIANGNCSDETLWFEIKRGVSVDESAVLVTDASCNTASGSIKGIKVANHTASDIQYSWKDAAGNEVGKALELTDVKPGSYVLTIHLADNSCTMPFGPIIVDNLSGPSLQEDNVAVSASTCGKTEGSIVGLRTAGTGHLRYEWKNSTGEIVATALDLTGQPAGSYTLHVFDESACGSISSSVIQIPEINGVSLEDSGLVQDATCGESNGSISGIQVSGATSYQWFNESGDWVKSTPTPDLPDVAAGSYYLVAANATCNRVSKLYTVGGGIAVKPPSAHDLQLCNGGNALLIVSHAAAGYGYRLYGDALGSILLDDQPSGRFSIYVKESRSFYISQYIGNCESERSQVNVSVGYASLTIPNTFSPNSDGINDTWAILGIENYPDVHVKIFNRHGTTVFVSNDYNVPFDGDLNGSPLPVGAYYYIIDIGDECGPISGSLNLLR